MIQMNSFSYVEQSKGFNGSVIVEDDYGTQYQCHVLFDRKGLGEPAVRRLYANAPVTAADKETAKRVADAGARERKVIFD
jgi:hypothetical protein